MKKLLMMLAVAVVAMGLTGCDDTVLSSSSAKKAIKKEAMFAKDYATKVFKTGYYEVDESDLNQLAQLQAAGMVTYTYETFVEKVSKRTYNYWSGYTYYTVDVEHIFAKVDLTDEGRKLVVENPTELRSDIFDDLKANKDYEETVPAYMSAAHGQATPAPAAVKEEEVVEMAEVVEVADSAATDTVAVVEEVVEEPAPAKADPNAAYEAACAKVNTEEHHMLLGRFHLEKVKEIRCTEEMAKNGVGECKAIITFKDKTPFGFVLGAPQQGYLHIANVSFLRYEDMGWLVNKIDD